MRFLKSSSDAAHREVRMLLPWYVNGTLKGMELTKVRQHLRACILCRRELAEQQQWAQAIGQSSGIELAPHAALTRLLERIDSEPPLSDERETGGSRRRSRWPRLLRGLSGARLSRRAWIAAPILISWLALAPTARLWLSSAPREPQYHTLASPNSAPAIGDTDIQVIFAHALDQEQIQQLLRSLPAAIVAGPDAADAYTVRLIMGDRSDQEMLRTLVWLSQQPGVLRVEPIDSSASLPNGGGRGQ